MEIGKDISQKIRSAIKAKLIELGAYVDDELPDYIMVMVANKKSQAQMTDDLSLFLSTNTEKFTSWLSGLLNKLQTLGTDKQKSQEIEKSQNECSRQETTIKKKKTPEKGEKSSAEKKEKPTKVAKSSATKIQKNSKDGKKLKNEEEYVPLLLDKGETDEFSEEFKPEEDKSMKKTPGPAAPQSSLTKPKSAATKTSPPTSVASSESSKVKPDMTSAEDTTYVRSVMVRPSVTKRLGSVHSRIGQVPKAMAAPVRRTPSDSQRQVSPVKRKQPMSVVGNVKRKFTEFEDKEEYDPYNPAVGSVASVIRVTDRKSSVPPSMQANKSLLVKAVDAAEKSVSSKMQQILNKEKMYSEKESATVRPFQRLHRQEVSGSDSTTTGNKSVTLSGSVKSRTGIQKQVSRGAGKVAPGASIKARIGVRPVQSQKDIHVNSVVPMKVTVNSGVKSRSELQLVSKIPKQDRMLKDLRYTIANNVEKKEPEVARVPPVMDSRLVQCVQMQGGSAEEETNSSEEYEDLGEVISKSPEVVSDEYVEGESVSEEFPDLEENEGEDEVTELNETDPEIQQVLENEDNDLDIVSEEQEYPTEPIVPVVQPDQRRFIKERVEPVAKRTTAPKFIVTLDGVDHDKYERAMGRSDEETGSGVLEQEETVQAGKGVNLVNLSKDVVQKVISPPEVRPISISLKDTDDEEEDMEVDNDTPLQKAKMGERCRFWPACVNGNACPYHHPTIPCKMFPQCKFGDKCLYIHPNCKFDAKCTRKDCPYTHASKRGTMATTIIQQIVPVPIPTPQPTSAFVPKAADSSYKSFTCKFYPNCKNMSCPFTHPTPCRFGMSCMKKAQCQFYHPALPTKDKLKWTASNKQEHISERKFDASGPAKAMPTPVT